MVWISSVASLYECLSNLLVTRQDQLVPVDEAFDTLYELTDQIRQEKRVIYFIGNGASASMASHYSADLAKNGKLHTQVLTDLSLITAVSNDIHYHQVFSEPLKYRIRPKEMLIAISSSGNSPNILEGVKTALEFGATVITLSAMKEDNHLRKVGHLNFYIKTKAYGMSETGHNAILHHWIDLMMENEQMENEQKVW